MRAVRPTSCFLALAAAVTLSGCLLPQPDTPIIPPLPQAAGRSTGPGGVPAVQPAPQEGAVPATAPAPQQDTMLTPVNPVNPINPTQPGDAGAPKATGAAPGQLEGTVRGRKALRVTAVPVTEGEKVVSEVTSDGTFAFALQPGSYWLDLELEGESSALRVDTKIRIESGESRKLTLSLSENPPRATVSEVAPLVAPTP
jgi:hypothetical protein